MKETRNLRQVMKVIAELPVVSIKTENGVNVEVLLDKEVLGVAMMKMFEHLENDELPQPHVCESAGCFNGEE